MTERTSWEEIKKPRSDAAQRTYEDEARISDFRELVYRLRAEAALTQAQLAELIGTTQSAIARMEGGGTQPRLETLQKMAQAVGADLVIGIATGLGSEASIERLRDGGSAVVIKARSPGRLTPHRHDGGDERKLMSRKARTGKAAASAASKTLRSGKTSRTAKSAAGSALSQRKTSNVTRSAAGKAAGRTLNTKGAAKASRSSAGSTLSQRPSRSKTK